MSVSFNRFQQIKEQRRRCRAPPPDLDGYEVPRPATELKEFHPGSDSKNREPSGYYNEIRAEPIYAELEQDVVGGGKQVQEKLENVYGEVKANQVIYDDVADVNVQPMIPEDGNPVIYDHLADDQPTAYYA